MGYFSNGTEGEIYQERWCDRCAHDAAFRASGEDSCPVWDAHLAYNGEEGPSKVLDMLIPRGNERCLLFRKE